MGKSAGGLGEVQNKDLGPKRRLSPVVVKGIVVPFTPRGDGIPGKLLFSRSRGVNVFVGVGNDLTSR